MQDIVIGDQYRKDRSEEGRIDLYKHIQPSGRTVIRQDPWTGAYCQDPYQDYCRPVLHLESVHKCVCRRHHIARKVRGHLGKKNESKRCDQQNLIMYHLGKRIDWVSNACRSRSHGSNQPQQYSCRHHSDKVCNTTLPNGKSRF